MPKMTTSAIFGRLLFDKEYWKTRPDSVRKCRKQWIHRNFKRNLLPWVSVMEKELPAAGYKKATAARWDPQNGFQEATWKGGRG